jgi:hypothetical protein
MLPLLIIAVGVLLAPVVWVICRLVFFTYRYKKLVARLPKELPCYKSKQWPIVIMYDPTSGYEKWTTETGVFDESGQPLPHFFAVSLR